MTRQTFFEHTVLERDLGDDFLVAGVQHRRDRLPTEVDDDPEEDGEVEDVEAVDGELEITGEGERRQQQRRSSLMATIDGLNRRYGSGTVQWAACGLQSPWRMRRSRLSRAATTRLADLPTVLAR